MCAIEVNNSAAVDMILATPAGKWGLNNLVDQLGNTALHYAYAASNQQFVRHLLASGEVNEATLQHRNTAGQLPQESTVSNNAQIADKVNIPVVTPPALPVSQASGLSFLLAHGRYTALFDDIQMTSKIVSVIFITPLTLILQKQEKKTFILQKQETKKKTLIIFQTSYKNWESATGSKP
ncbi:hypothetical protein [Candidatus Fukatsuia endosymbiont of Tuberolachnus salignus]|uniref:hypothetical protein n=1 Tax=Candidatus Fukatsuia endosymbiont of Tuberolachnus salignus TaxID=3077957 RepID=UPI00313ABC92